MIKDILFSDSSNESLSWIKDNAFTDITTTTFSDVKAMAYGNGKYLFAGNNGKLLITDNIESDTWMTSTTFNNIYTTNTSCNDIIFSNNKFIAIGENGKIASSTDGINWTLVSSTSTILRSIIYANSLYVVVGGDKACFTSTDGVTWVDRSGNLTNSSGGYLFDLTYGNGKFVAVGSLGSGGAKIVYSTDGITWNNVSDISNILTTTMYSVTYGNGKFVTVGNDGESATSTDGITWYSQVNLSTLVSNANDIITNGSRFLASAHGSKLAYSSNGINWSKSYVDGLYNSDNFYKLGFMNGFWFASTYTGKLFYSNSSSGTFNIVPGFSSNFIYLKKDSFSISGDESIMTVISSNKVLNLNSNGTWYDASFYIKLKAGNKSLKTGTKGIILGDSSLCIAGGPNWSSDAFIPSSYMTAIGYTTAEFNFIRYLKDKYIAIGVMGTIGLISTDGITWTKMLGLYNAIGSSGVRAIAYGNGIFVAVGNTAGKVATSTDGITWVGNNGIYDKIGNLSMHNVSFLNGIFFAYGNNGKYLTSIDGIIWTLYNSLSLSVNPDTINNMLYVNNIYYATTVGAEYDSITSTHRFHGRLFYSHNGTDWTEDITIKNIFYNNAITDMTCYKNKLFVFGTESLLYTSNII